MAVPQIPAPGRFFVGVLACDAAAARLARSALAALWGEPVLDWGPEPFDATRYYEEECGPHPLRAFHAFPEPMPLDLLAARKLRTNRLEIELAQTLAGPWPRPVNLDPGYVTRAQLTLASAKNFSHRIYLASGIFAEVTRLWRHGDFVNLPWTFPDYASGRYDDFFRALRAQAPAAGRASGAGRGVPGTDRG